MLKNKFASLKKDRQEKQKNAEVTPKKRKAEVQEESEAEDTSAPPHNTSAPWLSDCLTDVKDLLNVCRTQVLKPTL